MITSIDQEFAGADLNDARLTKRAMMIAARWAASPDASFPKMVPAGAELGGLYGFFENDAVEYASLLEAHKQQTLRRIDAEHGAATLVLHDTTSFSFGGEGHRDDVGWIDRNTQGFFAHFALAVSADGSRRPFGVVGLHIFMRDRPPPRAEKEAKEAVSKKERAANPDRESLRWGELVQETSTLLRGHAVPIHIVDREAESYEFLAKMITGGHRFVARARVLDRAVFCLSDETMKPAKLRVIAERSVPIAERGVHLNRRRMSPLPSQNKKHPPRDARDTRLEVAATTIQMQRPEYLNEALPHTITMNVVHVREVDPPDGVEPVEWTLLTTEPIENAEDVLRIVDYYRARWTIEEFFKAIKTGCAYETRQLESAQALFIALAFCIPIAWQMLLLRTQGRTDPEAPASSVVTEERLDVLRTIARKPLPPNPTARQVYYAIAALGGYLERNGPPGWKTLREGLDRVLFAEQVLAADAARRRCGQ
ncbi:MAG: IS4 family transposase [Byssovorax sp.]